MAMLPTPNFGMGGAGMTAAGAATMNPWMLMAGLGSMTGGLANLFNSPSKAAQGYSEQLPGTVTPYYQPYIDTGLRSLDTLENQFQQLVNDPNAIMQMLGGQFQQSPGYQWQYDQAMNAGTNAAASGGMAGGTAHQQQAMGTASGLANQDYWNFMDYMSGLYGTGLSGLGNLNQMGYGASDALAGLLAQNLMNQAQMAAYGAQNQNSALGSLVGGVTGALSSF
jgi:hypothetical protein